MKKISKNKRLQTKILSILLIIQLVSCLLYTSLFGDSVGIITVVGLTDCTIIARLLFKFIDKNFDNNSEENQILK